MPTHFVCLTFDLDNASSSISRDMTTPTAISRGDFGMVGTERILRLLRQYEIAGTWFIPGHTIATYPASCATVVEGGHEIAHHGWTHRIPATLSREEEEEEIVRGTEAIVGLCGQAPRGYRSPAWDLSEHSVDLLLKHGFVYDSSLMGHDYLPYQAREYDRAPLKEPVDYGADTALVELPISWSLDDFPAFEFMASKSRVMPGLMNASLVLENWLDDYAYMAEHEPWGIVTYTFHPHVIGRGHRMIMLEKLIRALRQRGATFITMERAVDEYRTRFPEGRSERGR